MLCKNGIFGLKFAVCRKKCAACFGLGLYIKRNVGDFGIFFRKARWNKNRVDRPAGFPAGRASHTTVRTGHVYSGSLGCGAIDSKSEVIDSFLLSVPLITGYPA